MVRKSTKRPLSKVKNAGATRTKTSRRKTLLSNEDRLSFSYVLDCTKHKVLGFSCTYQIYINGKWEWVVRYDTQHGYLYKHRRTAEDPNGSIRTNLTDMNFKDYNAAAGWVTKDITLNWEKYKAYFMEIKGGSGDKK